jgi:hypothetical protein
MRAPDETADVDGDPPTRNDNYTTSTPTTSKAQVRGPSRLHHRDLYELRDLHQHKHHVDATRQRQARSGTSAIDNTNTEPTPQPTSVLTAKRGCRSSTLWH